MVGTPLALISILNKCTVKALPQTLDMTLPTNSFLHPVCMLQRVPHFLLALDDPIEEMEALAAASGVKGCAICGGLGHRATQCPKLQVCICVCVWAWAFVIGYMSHFILCDNGI